MVGMTKIDNEYKIHLGDIRIIKKDIPKRVFFRILDGESKGSEVYFIYEDFHLVGDCNV